MYKTTTETREVANTFHARVGEMREKRNADLAYYLNQSATQLSRTDLTSDQRLEVLSQFARLFDSCTEDLRDELLRELRALSRAVGNIGR